MKWSFGPRPESSNINVAQGFPASLPLSVFLLCLNLKKKFNQRMHALYSVASDCAIRDQILHAFTTDHPH